MTTGIHGQILNRIQSSLQYDMIDRLASTDATRAGVVKQGDLQGEPDPDIARISITLYENDPDSAISGAVSELKRKWNDEIYDVEIGGTVIWRRRFCVKVRFLFENTKEGLMDARDIVSTVRSRLENSLMRISFSGVNTEWEFVSRGIVSPQLGEALQSGGPPDSYDFFAKYRIELLTTSKPL